MAPPGLAPLKAPPPQRYLLGPREWMLVELFERRAEARARMAARAEESGKTALAQNMASESKVWRQAAQLVREQWSRVDIDLREPTIPAFLRTQLDGEK